MYEIHTPLKGWELLSHIVKNQRHEHANEFIGFSHLYGATPNTKPNFHTFINIILPNNINSFIV